MRLRPVDALKVFFLTKCASRSFLVLTVVFDQKRGWRMFAYSFLSLKYFRKKFSLKLALLFMVDPRSSVRRILKRGGAETSENLRGT